MKTRFLMLFALLYFAPLAFCKGGIKINIPVTEQDLTPQICKVQICGKNYTLSTREDYIAAIEEFKAENSDKLMLAVYNPEFTMVKVNRGYDHQKGTLISWVDGEIDPYYLTLNVELKDVVNGLSVRAGWAPNVKCIGEIEKLRRAYLAIYPSDELKILSYLKSIYQKSDFILYCDLCDGNDNIIETKYEPILKMYVGQNFGHKVFTFPLSRADEYYIKFRFADITTDPNIMGKEESIMDIKDAFEAEAVSLQEFYDMTYGDSLELLEFGKGVYTLVYPDYIKFEWKNHLGQFLGVDCVMDRYFPKDYSRKNISKGDFHPWMYKQKTKDYYDVLAMKNHSSNFIFSKDGITYRLADYGCIYIPDTKKLDSSVYDIRQIRNSIGD